MPECRHPRFRGYDGSFYHSSVFCHSGLSGIFLQKDSRRALLAGMTHIGVYSPYRCRKDLFSMFVIPEVVIGNPGFNIIPVAALPPL
jgi:hypothetical protein